MSKIDNKWRLGDAHWCNDFQFLDDLFENKDRDGGIKLSKVGFDPDIGKETVLFLVDKTPFVHELAKLQPFTLNILPRVLLCPSGPVLVVVYYVDNPDPKVLKPYVSIESIYNPHNPVLIQLLQDLDNQAYWHLFIVGPNYKFLKWIEFKNNFNLQETLTTLPEIIQENPCHDFVAAAKEYEEIFPEVNIIQVKSRSRYD